MMVLAGIIVWCAFLVRDVLLIVYVSGLLAIGFSPIVRLIERQKVLPIGTRRFRAGSRSWCSISRSRRLDRGRFHGRAAAIDQGQQL